MGRICPFFYYFLRKLKIAKSFIFAQNSELANEAVSKIL
jgi:hypothetical protein